MDVKLPYDKTDKQSILNYAQLLKDKSLSNILSKNIDNNNINYLSKGGLGNMIEELYFFYKPNSESQADFPEAGIELKTTPLKKINKGYVSKERLVFNIINYMEEHKKVFRTSSFWKKNSELLLMFYLYEKEKLPIDYIFKIIRLWRFPEADLKIIIDDWNVIVNKIRVGKAHELSEGDTLYLGACTKGATKASLRRQPFSDELAMQRAFSLKSKYLNFIIENSLLGIDYKIDQGLYDYLLSESNLSREEYEEYKRINLKEVDSIIKSVKDYKHGETFEEFVVSKFQSFIGNSESELIKRFNLEINPKAKNRYNVICNRIMGVNGKYVEEFIKADIEMKTIVLEENGNLKESMSFQQIKYKEILTEDWLDSYWYYVLTKRFFFVVFQRDKANNPRLKKVIFWSMPTKDLIIAENFWEDTKSKVKAESFESFIKMSDNLICHVRPKAKDSKDLMETINGNWVKKKAYWLNSGYIKNIVS